jgi:plastocyanin
MGPFSFSFFRSHRHVLLAASVIVVGCSTPTTTKETVPANPDLTVYAQDIKFDKKEYSAKAGTVSVAYISKGNQLHDMVLEDASGNKVGNRIVVAGGESTGMAVPLTTGTYKMYCSIPGHKQSMNATLTVTP